VPLFTVTEARTYDNALANETAYPSPDIEAKEIAIRVKFERVIGVALEPTTLTEYCDGNGSDTLFLAHHNPWSEPNPRPVTVTSVSLVAVDGTETAFAADELAVIVAYDNKLIRRSGWPHGRRNIKVVYTHGYVEAPDDIKGAALVALCLPKPDGLKPVYVPGTAYEGDMDGIRWSRVKDPDRGRWYGHEGVDAVLREHRAVETLPGIA
jgi:hypothetical protein